MTLPTDGYDRDALAAFLARLSAAFGTGDLQAVSESFAFPALVVGPGESVLVPDAEPVVAGFRERLAGHEGDDLVAAVAQVQAVEEVTDDLLWVRVRWSYRDENASEGASDAVRYLLRRGRDTFEICVAVPVPG